MMTIPTFTPISWQFAARTKHLQASFIRELLKVTQRPDIISFAGGLPSPDTFPENEIRAACDKVLAEQGRVALQYGRSDGYQPLREWLAKRLSTDTVKINYEQVLITVGAQQGLDLLAKVLIDEGSKVLVEKSSYLGALQAFSVFFPELISVEVDENGALPESIAELGSDARFFYAQPNFQNPTGRRMSIDRRKKIVDICAKLGVPIIEDDPYGELCYEGEPLPKMLTMNPEVVIYSGSFSKIVSPGIRLGYVIAPTPLFKLLELAKQPADLHTPQLNQMMLYELIKDDIFLAQHIPKIRKLYAQRCQVMLDALEEYFPKDASWTHPEGGMFIWVTLPKYIDTIKLLEEALKEKVAFVPGAPFYAQNPEHNTLRLSFVTAPPELIRKGIARLGKVIAAQKP